MIVEMYSIYKINKFYIISNYIINNYITKQLYNKQLISQWVKKIKLNLIIKFHLNHSNLIKNQSYNWRQSRLKNKSKTLVMPNHQ